MNKVACRYAIIQFIPYPETGEFANVGLVLACPSKNYFDYKLETRKFGRLTHFFRDLDPKVFLRSIAAFQDELERVRTLLINCGGEENIRQAFQTLIHPRDAILRFGGERPILVDAPAQALTNLFGRYIEHDFVTPEYRENQLEKRVQQLVNDLNLPHPFAEARLGGEDFNVRFPFVQWLDDKPHKIIKPFYLGQDEANKIYDHGDRWLMKLRRLRERNQLPPKVLFAVEGPLHDEGKRIREKAFEEICHDFNQLVEIVPQAQEEKIIQFALN